MEDKEEKIKTFLMEFSKESRKVVGQHTLKEQQNLLERLLRTVLRNFFINNLKFYIILVSIFFIFFHLLSKGKIFIFTFTFFILK